MFTAAVPLAWLFISRHCQCLSHVSAQFSRIFDILCVVYCDMPPSGCETYNACAQRVTLRPSLRQCAGFRSSFLQSIKSSIPISTTCTDCYEKSTRTIIIFTIFTNEECSALQWCAGGANLVNMRHARWHRSRLAIGLCR
jgi:hypothetical protein